MNITFITLWLSLYLATSPAPGVLYILPAGDSITQGGKRDRPEYTYRLPLQMLLIEEGIAFDFIGSRQQGLHEDASWPDPAPDVPFDPDHEGYYGNKTRDVCRKLMIAFRQYEHKPDIVLVHLGTNDQQAGDYENTVGKPLRELITFLRRHNPQVVILLGHLNFNDGEKILAIREVVEQVAVDLDTDISPVRTVHHYRGWIAQPDRVYTDTFDWAHPNLKGQEKMAHNWYQAMQPFLEAYRR